MYSFEQIPFLLTFNLFKFNKPEKLLKTRQWDTLLLPHYHKKHTNVVNFENLVPQILIRSPNVD